MRIAALELAAPRTEPPIAHLLNDDDPAVVSSKPHGPAESGTLLRTPRSNSSESWPNADDPLVREAAVAALGALGDEQGLPAVAATTDKPAVRRRAVLALAAFDGPEVDAAWERARSDRDRQVRDAVDELLGPVDDGQAG